MKILVVGSGGREGALSWRLSQDPGTEIFVWPGNPGTPKAVGADAEEVAATTGADLVVIGPEKFLADGLADRLRYRGFQVLGPGRDGARLEASKAFAKEIMAAAGIPTAAYASFSDPLKAKAYIRANPEALVVKADGLCAGKGVVVAANQEEAMGAVDYIMKNYGGAVVVEEKLGGREVSLLALTDGEKVLPFPLARDHKRVFDADQGPNTGGMGALAPVPEVSEAEARVLSREILEPTVRALKEKGISYRGVIYAGLMLSKNGPKVLEFNARFGDPETQVIVPLVDGNLSELLLAAAKGDLGSRQLVWKRAAAVTVVLASGGYPGHYETGKVITGLEEAAREPGVVVFQAGTDIVGGNLLTAGGRVLGVTATGPNLEGAIVSAYRAVGKIAFEGVHFRKDIGQLAP